MMEFRASEFGMCVRAQVARALGYREMPVPDVLENAYARGNEHEDLCVGAMQASGWWISGQQTEVDFLGITGHLDGLCRQGNEFPTRVLEAKAPRAWESFERAYKTDTWTDPLMVRYAWQTSIYMLAMEMECVVACWDEERGVRWFVIEHPIFTAGDVALRKGIIESIVQQDRVPDTCEPNGFDDWSCPFRYLHEKPEHAEDRELDRLARAYTHANAEKKAAEKVVSEVRAQLLEYLIDNGQDSIETNAAKVTRYFQTREDPDRIAMKEDGVWEKYAKKTKSETLRVTIRGSSDAES